MEKEVLEYAQKKVEELLNQHSFAFPFVSRLKIKKVIEVRCDERPYYHRYSYGDVWTSLSDNEDAIEIRITLFEEFFQKLNVNGQKDLIDQCLTQYAMSEIDAHCALFEFCDKSTPNGPNHWKGTLEFYKYALTKYNYHQPFTEKVNKYITNQLVF